MLELNSASQCEMVKRLRVYQAGRIREQELTVPLVCPADFSRHHRDELMRNSAVLLNCMLEVAVPRMKYLSEILYARISHFIYYGSHGPAPMRHRGC
jgi:hypothetical protein